MRMENHYDVARAKELGNEAYVNCRHIWEPLLNEYNLRSHDEVMSFCGYGRAGKDEAASYLTSRYGFTFVGGTSVLALPLIAESVFGNTDPMTLAHVFRERHNNRQFWFQFLNAFREKDPTLLVKMSLARSDFTVGVRSSVELFACLSQKVITFPIWIENQRVEADPTVEYSANDCAITIANNGSKFDYYRKLDALMAMFEKYPK